MARLAINVPNDGPHIPICSGGLVARSIFVAISYSTRFIGRNGGTKFIRDESVISFHRMAHTHLGF